MDNTFENKPYIVKPWRLDDIEKLESLGIEMIPNSPPCGTFVNIPDGWTFKKESGYIVESTTIYDDKGRRRIYSCHFFPVKRYVQDDILRFDTRYFIRRAKIGKRQLSWMQLIIPSCLRLRLRVARDTRMLKINAVNS